MLTLTIIFSSTTNLALAFVILFWLQVSLPFPEAETLLRMYHINIIMAEIMWLFTVKETTYDSWAIPDKNANHGKGIIDKASFTISGTVPDRR